MTYLYHFTYNLHYIANDWKTPRKINAKHHDDLSGFAIANRLFYSSGKSFSLCGAGKALKIGVCPETSFAQTKKEKGG
jgi:hypothetical protein